MTRDTSKITDEIWAECVELALATGNARPTILHPATLDTQGATAMNKTAKHDRAITEYRTRNHALGPLVKALRAKAGVPAHVAGLIGCAGGSSRRVYVDRLEPAVRAACGRHNDGSMIDTESARGGMTLHAAEACLAQLDYWSSVDGTAELHDAGLIDLGALACAFAPVEACATF
jgi:hypothetical protein